MTSANPPDLLTTVIDTVVPADDFPSASAAGGLEFLHRIRDRERPDWSRRINAVVARLDAAAWRTAGTGFTGLDGDGRRRVLAGVAEDPEVDWFVRLINLGYYGDTADADGSGTRQPAAWQMVDWRPEPAGGWPADLPPVPFERDGLIDLPQLRPRYDAVVIGSGAGGGTTAQVLAESGRTVLIIEAGGTPATTALSRDHLRNPRIATGLDPLTGPSGAGHQRTLQLGDRRLVLDATDPRWSNNAFTVGGGTRVYGAQAWRFTPEDFRMASEYGVPEDSSLADWPIGYADLEPYYSEAEWRFGVSGQGTRGPGQGDPWAGDRSRDYPMPPVSGTGRPAVLAEAAARLGWNTLPPPLLINSHSYRGRMGCQHCSQCVGFACPVEAKAGSHNTSVPAALATGRGFLVTRATAERLITDPAGRVTGVALVAERDGRNVRTEVQAETVVVSAGAVESARLLLASASDREPAGLGNNADQVGRHLQGHVYAGALGLFDDEYFGIDGPGPSIATCDFRHHNPGLVGGGMIANEFVPTPVSTFGYLVDAGIFPPYGVEAKRGMRHWARRMERVVGPIQEVTTDDARVRLDPEVRDRFGNPVAALTGSLHPADRQAQQFLTARAAEWLEAAGACRVVPASPPGTGITGPSGGQHQAGTCRMGTDPATSVTDPHGRVWGHDNLYIADGSLHVTNGGVNPVLTILANSLRVADLLVNG